MMWVCICSEWVKNTRRYFNLSKCEIANLSFTDIYWMELWFGVKMKKSKRERERAESGHKCKSPTTSTIDLSTVERGRNMVSAIKYLIINFAHLIVFSLSPSVCRWISSISFAIWCMSMTQNSTEMCWREKKKKAFRTRRFQNTQATQRIACEQWIPKRTFFGPDKMNSRAHFDVCNNETFCARRIVDVLHWLARKTKYSIARQSAIGLELLDTALHGTEVRARTLISKSKWQCYFQCKLWHCQWNGGSQCPKQSKCNTYSTH